MWSVRERTSSALRKKRVKAVLGLEHVEVDEDGGGGGSRQGELMKASEPRGGNNSRRHRCQRPKTPRSSPLPTCPSIFAEQRRLRVRFQASHRAHHSQNSVRSHPAGKQVRCNGNHVLQIRDTVSTSGTMVRPGPSLISCINRQGTGLSINASPRTAVVR